VCSDLLSCYKAESENFFVTGDEKQIHCFEPNQKDSEWNDIIQLLLRRRSLTTHPTGKAKATVFWDAPGVVLVGTMPCGQSINSDL
jgi:hypothetical protein